MTEFPTITGVVVSEQEVIYHEAMQFINTNNLDEQMTDVGNARFFVSLNEPRLRYVNGWGWLIWKGKRWSKDTNGRVVQMAITSIEELYKIAQSLPASEGGQGLSTWAKNSLSKMKIMALIELAKSDPRITAEVSNFDNNPWLLNVQNGTINLKTGTLHEHNPLDMITQIFGTYFHPGAGCPVFLNFLDRIMHGNQAMISYLQRGFGYSLSGNAKEQCLFFLHGEGQNGKTTLINTFSSLMGDYAAKTKTDTLLQKNNVNNTNDIARLAGKRFVYVSEMNFGQKLNESLVKDMTGGDKIVARFLYKEHFEFKPVFKIWMQGNHKPEIRGTDLGIWRRIRLIPFNVTITDEEKDQELEDKLHEEMSGILNWAIQGCLDWQDSGLIEPELVKNATSSYRQEMDQVSRFIGEELIKNETAKITKDEMYRAYTEWCMKSGETTLTKNLFGRQLKRLGSEEHKGTGGTRFWLGVKPLGY